MKWQEILKEETDVECDFCGSSPKKGDKLTSVMGTGRMSCKDCYEEARRKVNPRLAELQDRQKNQPSPPIFPSKKGD